MVKIIDKLVDHLQSKFDSVGLRRQVRNHKQCNRPFTCSIKELGSSKISIHFIRKVPSSVIRGSITIVYIQNSLKYIEISCVSESFSE